MTINWENPILTKELRTGMRGAKAFWILLLYLGLLSVILGGTYLSWLSGQERQGAYATQSYDMGRMFYAVIFAVQAALVGLITPALTSGALSIEREQRTFEALAISPLPRRSIILGKLTSAVGFVGLLLLSSLPLVALCFLLGGVSPQEVTAAYVLLMASAFLYGATGIAYSSFAKNTTTATVLTYGTILLFFVGTLPLVMMGVNLSNASLSTYSQPFLLAVNPVGAMVAGNLTENCFGLAIPSWLIGFTVNGLLGTILTIVALHRIEYPRTDRSALLRVLTAVFVGLIAFLTFGQSGRLSCLSAVPLLPLIFVPIFVAGEGLPKGTLLSSLFKLKNGNPISGLTYVLALMVLIFPFALGGWLGHPNDYPSHYTSSVFDDGFLVTFAVTLGAAFGFGMLTLLLSHKLKNRWGAMALVFAIMAVIYFLPLTTELHSADEQPSIFINSFYLSPFSFFSGINSVSQKALAFGSGMLPWINIAFTGLLGLVSLALLKRARR